MSQLVNTTGQRSGESLPAEQVVMRLYEIGVQSCEERDKEKATRVVKELIGALDFNYPEVANTFYQLYLYVVKMLEEDNYRSASEILIEIRDTWDQLVLAPQQS